MPASSLQPWSTTRQLSHCRKQVPLTQAPDQSPPHHPSTYLPSRSPVQGALFDTPLPIGKVTPAAPALHTVMTLRDRRSPASRCCSGREAGTLLVHRFTVTEAYPATLIRLHPVAVLCHGHRLHVEDGQLRGSRPYRDGHAVGILVSLAGGLVVVALDEEGSRP